MKFYLVYILILCSIVFSFAQVGINNPNPDTTSILDLTSNKLGLLIPRMNSFERKAIVDPANGLLVYDTDDAMLYYFDATHNNGALPNAWTGLSALRFSDDESFPKIIIGGASGGGDTTIYTRNLYTHETVKNVGIGTSSPLNKLTIDGGVSIGDSTATGIAPDKGLFVKGNTETDTLKSNVVEGYGTVPVGTIVMWSGSIAPDGWVLCDGGNIIDAASPLNGTQSPDLKGRFVVGIGNNGSNTYDYGDNAGEDSHRLLATEIPSHTHSGTTSTDGSHEHDYNDLTVNRTDVNGSNFNNQGISGVPDNERTTDPAGNHSHTFTTDGGTGGNGAHENRPMYFALAYIMRIK